MEQLCGGRSVTSSLISSTEPAAAEASTKENPRFAYARLDPTRDNSQRQLPTDHDYAVPTREYQTDQSSLKTAPAAARSVLEKTQRQLQNIPTDFAVLTRSLHIRAMHSSNLAWGSSEAIAGTGT